jgi:molecular chaperone DnaJ
MSKDYYIVLGVSKGADLERIKKAYRRIAKKYHPDTSRSEETTPRFIEAQEAFETLADTEKRRQHDMELATEGAGDRIQRVPEIVRVHRRSYRDRLESYFSDADDFFSGFVGGLFDTEKERPRGKDLYLEAALSPTEALEGGLYPITVPVLARCSRCAGTGYWEDFYCTACRGYGRVRTEREFSLTIPPHVKEGTEITLSLEDIGLRGTLLHIVVRIDPDLE